MFWGVNMELIVRYSIVGIYRKLETLGGGVPVLGGSQGTSNNREDSVQIPTSMDKLVFILSYRL
jgi:hypothetical protein